MAEQDYYENYGDLDPEEFIRRTQLDDPEEQIRHARVAAAVPASARSVLDIGCGAGIILHHLKAARPDLALVGIERSRTTAAAGRRMFGLDIREESAEALGFADGAFDVVMATEVIEHLPTPIYRTVLAEMERIARQRIIITVPYRERRQFVTCPACSCVFSPIFHLRTYDDPDLASLFERFERVEFEIMDGPGPLPGIYALRRLKALLGRVPELPAYAICPQCGHRRPSAAGGGGAAAPTPGGRVRLQRRILEALPRPRRPRWALAVYAPR